MKKLVGFCILLLLLLGQFAVYSNGKENVASEQSIRVSIIYDNYNFKEGMNSDWGFSCLIEINEQEILFDTGARNKIFKHNVEALPVNLNTIDYVVISHGHYDHTGGLETFLDANNDVVVYMLQEFSSKIKNVAIEHNTKISCEQNLKEITKNVYLSGVLGDKIKEQALAIKTEKGLVVVTGCSHPGIIKIIKHFKSELNEEVYMVFGGFHLMKKSTDEMNEIILEMKNLDVKKCGATHCTGKKQIEMFKDAFGENYVQMGVGRILEL